MSEQRYIQRQAETNRGMFLPLEFTAIGCRVFNNANISIATATTTALTFNSERDDDLGMHSTSSNTGRITCLVAGTYVIGAHVEFAANSTGDRAVQLRLNGSTVIGQQISRAANTLNHDLTIASRYVLAATDYVEVLVFQDSGGALNVIAAGAYTPEFWAWRLP